MKYTILKSRYIDDINGSIINETNDAKTVNKMINDYTQSIGFKSYYWRTLMFTENNSFVIDYGGYNDFIRIFCEDKESFQAYLETK